MTIPLKDMDPSSGLIYDGSRCQTNFQGVYTPATPRSWPWSAFTTVHMIPGSHGKTVFPATSMKCFAPACSGVILSRASGRSIVWLSAAWAGFEISGTRMIQFPADIPPGVFHPVYGGTRPQQCAFGAQRVAAPLRGVTLARSLKRSRSPPALRLLCNQWQAQVPNGFIDENTSLSSPCGRVPIVKQLFDEVGYRDHTIQYAPKQGIAQILSSLCPPDRLVTI